MFLINQAMESVGIGTAAVIVVLLSGTAAGYALGGGAFFQRMFDESPWSYFSD